MQYWFTRPADELTEAIDDYRREMLERGLGFAGCSRLRTMEAARWVEDCRLFEREETLPAAGFVPCTQFLCVALPGRTVAGVIQLRHRLNAYLLNYGGHIGYAVRPGFRRRGIAKWMLREALPHAKALGLDRVLVTCDGGNEASRRTILSQGGVLEDVRMEDGRPVERYWIGL